MNITLWYKPTCGTCQKVRAAIEAKGHKPTLVEYLKTPPSPADIDAVCRKAGIQPQELARRKEPLYEEIARKNLDRAGWLKALHENPVLIERPVVIVGDQAIVARPPERLAEIL